MVKQSFINIFVYVLKTPIADVFLIAFVDLHYLIENCQADLIGKKDLQLIVFTLLNLLAIDDEDSFLKVIEHQAILFVLKCFDVFSDGLKNVAVVHKGEDDGTEDSYYDLHCHGHSIVFGCWGAEINIQQNGLQVNDCHVNYPKEKQEPCVFVDCGKKRHLHYYCKGLGHCFEGGPRLVVLSYFFTRLVPEVRLNTSYSQQ